jgi:hypothetical protein
MTERYDLRALAREIHEWDPEGAVRLQSLADAVDEVGDSSGWVGADLFDGVCIPSILGRFEQKNAAVSSGWKSDRFRAGMALLPIAVTWLGLWHASGAYAKAVSRNPALADTPFLLLWQRGFDGLAGGVFGWMTFGRVAFLDALIIGVLIVSGWKAHTARYQNLVDMIAKKRDLEGRLQQSVWNASLVLGNRSSERAYVEQFRLVSERMLDQLAVERDRIAHLADERDRATADLTSVATDFKVGTFEFARHAMKIAEVSETQINVTVALESTITALTDAMLKLEALLRQSNQELIETSKSMVLIASHVRATNELVAENSDSANATIVEFGRLTERLNDQVTDITGMLMNDRVGYERAFEGLLTSGKDVDQATARLD